MNKGSDEKLLLEQRSIFWPVVIFPYHERSHTASIIGWKGHRPRVLKDMRASFAGKVWLSEGRLRARSFLLRSLISIEIPFDSIEGMKVSDQDDGLIEIHYQQAAMSRLLQIFAKGGSEGVILLKLDDQVDKWIQVLEAYLG